MESHTEVIEMAPASPALDEAAVTAQGTPEGPQSEGRRPMRNTRKAVITYNLQMLAGTAIHTPTKYLEKHHKNVLHGSLEDVLPIPVADPGASPRRRQRRESRSLRPDSEEINDPAEAQLATEAAQAAQRRKSSRVDLRKEAIRNLTAAGEAFANKGAELLTSGKNKVQNALRGSFTDTSSDRSVARGRGSRASKAQDDVTTDQEEEEEKEYKTPYTKQWEKQGLYVGQFREFDPRLKESQNRARRRSKQVKENKILPLPMFEGERKLQADYRRDFKLPFDVYNPLPRKIKVDGWVKLHKSEFCNSSLKYYFTNSHRSVHWRGICVVEEGQARFIAMLLPPGRRLRGSLSQPHHGIRVRRHQLSTHCRGVPQPPFCTAEAPRKGQWV
jgi:palmitoyltransferase ZDHHC9/14/18